MLCDSHTHLDEYPTTEVPEILERASEAGVDLVVCAGVTVESSAACIHLAETHRSFYAGVGIHPMNLEGRVDDATYQTLKNMATGNDKVVCISEIGLDYQPTSPDIEDPRAGLQGPDTIGQRVGPAHHIPFQGIPSPTLSAYCGRRTPLALG